MCWPSPIGHPMGSRDPMLTPPPASLVAGHRGIAWERSWGHMTPAGVHDRQEPLYLTPSYQLPDERNSRG